MNREKIIKKAERIMRSTVDRDMIDSFCEDVISLLQEQEAVEPFHKCIGNEFSLIEDSHFDFCPYCGADMREADDDPN
jgi:hypothetical protein